MAEISVLQVCMLKLFPHPLVPEKKGQILRLLQGGALWI